ncbi:GTP cyclohydrolase I FolE [Subtercola boreus]|uniref:GTP cyclohydrolase 1 n=1 Tax=Subtercola boreus TaxID=120213 RepID=A0A3E0VDG7_9MICO|nr:GTP cyclohydrolase I [Subtercola boreus]RFA07705.1 GTP cyclohydrolase I FolE [Subtercola boreus]
MAVDRGRVEAAVYELIAALGEDPSRAELESTPRRVAEAYSEFFSGVGVDARDQLGETYPFGGDIDGGFGGSVGPGAASGASPEPVLVKGLSFRSVCEHHLLPFRGTAHVAYVPRDRLVGLGRIPAVIEVLANRPQLQERLGEQIASTLSEGLDARGVLVVLEAAHGCVTLRGPQQVASTTVTVASRGSLSEPAARAELMGLIGAEVSS